MRPPALLLLFLAPITAFAAPIAVKELVADALAKNSEIKHYEAELDVARGGKQTAGEYANPEITAQLGGMSIAAQKDGLVWQTSLAQVVDFPGRMALRKAIADHDLQLAELGLKQFRAVLSNEVRSHAAELALLQKKTDAAKGVRDRVAALVEVLVQRDTGSVSAVLERRILEASLLTSDRALTDALKQQKEAQAHLAVLCGRDPAATLTVEEDKTQFPAVPKMEQLKQQAAQGNFDLAQKRIQVARQGLKVDLTKSERWGNITFGPYAAAQHAGGTQWEGGLSVSIPLPLWNKNKGNIAAEQARTSQAEALLATTLRDLERDLAVAGSAYQAELDALGRWKPESEQEFAKAAAEADKHYRLGAVPAATYVEMQRGYLDALDALIESRRNAWQHRMTLERLVGGGLK